MPTTIEARISRMLMRHQLDRIEIVITGNGRFVARTYPARYHPIIAERRKAAYHAAIEKKGHENFTITEAAEIENAVCRNELAAADAKTIEAAVSLLSEKLANLPK